MFVDGGVCVCLSLSVCVSVWCDGGMCVHASNTNLCSLTEVCVSLSLCVCLCGVMVECLYTLATKICVR